MKKITIVVLHLGYGGIEKAVTSFANMLCDKYKIEIISTYKLYEKPVFELDKRVDVKYLIDSKPNKKEWITAFKKGHFFTVIKESFKSIKLLYLKKSLMQKAIKKVDSDIIISTRALHNFMVGKYGKKQSLKIAWEHSHHNNKKKYINNLIKSCNEMSCLVCVSKELATYYQSGLDSDIKCIHISPSLDYFPDKISTLTKKEITSIGRLSKEKGFFDLIEVFVGLHKNYPDWKLNIIGDGLEKENIVKKVNEYHLDNSVIMHGFKSTTEVNNILNNTSIYVMTSFTESFGLVLIEAMSHGIPCVAFDSARGATEIIENDINGFIVPKRDKTMMIDKITSLIEDKQLRQRLGKSAHNKALTFNPKKIKAKWIELFDSK